MFFLMAPLPPTAISHRVSTAVVRLFRRDRTTQLLPTVSLVMKELGVVLQQSSPRVLCCCPFEAPHTAAASTRLHSSFVAAGIETSTPTGSLSSDLISLRASFVWRKTLDLNSGVAGRVMSLMIVIRRSFDAEKLSKASDNKVFSHAGAIDSDGASETGGFQICLSRKARPP